MVNQLLFTALDSMIYAIWVRDIDGKIVYCNNKFKQYCEEEGKSIEEVEEKEKDNAIELMNNINEKRFVRFSKDKYLEWNLSVLKDNNENTVGLVGCIKDITEGVLKEKELIEQKNILSTIINTIPDVIFYKDINSRYLGGNKVFANNINMPNGEFVGKTDIEIHPKSPEAKKFADVDKEIMKSKKNEVNFNKLYINGEESLWECTKAPIINEHNKVCGLVGVSRDVTERKRLEEKLRELSYKDKLTGLYNRTYFDEQIEVLNDEKFLPLSMIVGDVNGLKIVNDTLGHLEGDKFIIAITKIIKNTSPEEALIFRWGGDEIIILIPNKTELEAEKLVKMIQEEIAKSTYKPIPLSISLGVSSRDNLEKDIDTMLMEAENKVYRKKLLQNNSNRNGLIESLQKTLEEKNMETKEHTARLVKYASIIGKELALRDWEIDELKLLATLHDIGKIGVPEKILMKSGPLTDEEMDIMKSHTEKGYRIVQVSPYIAHVAKGVLTHHERWDGKGYPLGLKGKDIPFLSRIISVLDSYDAMTNDRVYKRGISRNEAIEELKRCSGTQFDPTIVDIFINKVLTQC